MGGKHVQSILAEQWQPLVQPRLGVASPQVCILLKGPRRIGPGGRLSRFVNAPQNGVCAGVADATNCHCHPTLNDGPHHPP